MARTKLNLQAYQQDILARLKELTESTGAVSSSKLGVIINGEHWLISLEDVSEVIPIPDITHVPQTQPWFMGMANVRGNLYGLTDLASFLGLPPTKISVNSRILLVHQKFEMNAGLLVERLVGLRSTEDMEKQDEAGEQPNWYAHQFKDANHQIWQEMNLGALMTQQSFMLVAA
jgi:twitching motility protein PilI